jgi:hypothetical protein
MLQLEVPVFSIQKDSVLSLLAENSIRVNEHAKTFFDHPSFSCDCVSGIVPVAIASLSELGCKDGATLPEILRKIPSSGFRLCRPELGLFLRLFWKDQPESCNSVLSGQHRAPDGAVTVLSEPLEADDAFPKGLYLRIVDGTLWLRGYVCDAQHVWSKDDLFALEC